MDRNELKNQALLERVSELATQYENRVADLRVEVTLQSQELVGKSAEIERLKHELAELREAHETNVPDDSSE